MLPVMSTLYLTHFISFSSLSLLFFTFHISTAFLRGSGVRVVSLEDTLEQEHEAFMDLTNRSEEKERDRRTD